MQKKYIRIESKGLIEEGAFTLLGASTKKGDSTKIGFFGSGLKFSLAFLLRNKIDFKVFSEYKEFVFTAEPETFRSNNFNVICVNGKKSSITTEAGGDWEPWFCLREIYCNALDEGDSFITIVNEADCVPIEDKTVFYFEVTPEFQLIIDNWKNYFSEGRKDMVYSDKNLNKLYCGGESLVIYRKGIRCQFMETQKCIFNYDLHWAEINESRVIKNDWDFKYNLVQFIKEISDKSIIAQILNTINSSWEKGLNWEFHSDAFANEWVEVIGKKTLVPYENAGFWEDWTKDEPHLYLTLPGVFIEALKTRFLDKINVIGDVDGVQGTGEFKPVPSLSKRQEALLQEAVDFLKNAEYIVKYPMKVVTFTAKNRLGQALDETILLSDKLFDLGRKELVAAIVEEQEHLVTGFSDETRSFQTHFIHKFISEMENKTGKYL